MWAFLVNSTMKISLVQPNFRQGGSAFSGYWLPYSVGCVYSYSAQSPEFKGKLELNKVVFRREKIEWASDDMLGDDIVLFSCYMWNWEYSKALAKMLKEKSPKTQIVFGGPQVTEFRSEEQIQQLPFVDTFIISEGELSVHEYLTDYEQGTTKKLYEAQRVTDLDIPSPYLTGVFDKIITDNPDIKWSTTLETNRGCPFSCTFCDWGSLTYAKVKKFPMEKVYQEIEWLGANEIQYIFMADANFGIFPDRDMPITDYILDVQKRTGYPATVNANWHKNAKQNVIEIVKKFISNGFNRGMTLSVQSMDDDVLKVIKRKNMESSHLGDMMDLLNKEGIGSYTELILPLPLETTDTWRQGLADVLDIGQHNSIEIWFHQVLENATSNLPEHKKEYGFETIELPDYVAGDREPDHDQHISEITEIVKATNTMSFEEFLDNWMYAWMIINFHCGGWAQVITRVWDKQGKQTYKQSYDQLFNAIQEDMGIVGKMYYTTRQILERYLTTGIMEEGAYGHTLFWYANRTFHKHYSEVMEFIGNTFDTRDKRSGLLETQKAFVSNITDTYPKTFECKWNYLEYINNADAKLIPKHYVWEIDTEKVWSSDEQYLEWLYFRRRQGFGKTKWHQKS